MKYLIAGVATIALGILAAAHRPLHAAEPSGVRAAITPNEQRKPAPAFCLGDASNHVVPLSQYLWKVVLLDFWATECRGCKVEIPWFMEFEKAYKSRRFEVVGVSMDIPYASLKDAAEGWKRDDDVTKAYAITALPVASCWTEPAGSPPSIPVLSTGTTSNGISRSCSTSADSV